MSTPTDWTKIDLNSHEVAAAIVDPLTFEDLLLVIDCNLPTITEATVEAQFEAILKANISQAREIFSANRKRIVAHACKIRK